MKKIILFAALLGVLIAISVWKLGSKLLGWGKDKAPTAQATPAPKKEERVEYRNEGPGIRALPEIRFQRARLRQYSDARNRGHVGPPWLWTGDGYFIQGEACIFGMVETVRCPDLAKGYAVARIKEPEGGTLYIVAEDSGAIDVGEKSDTATGDENTNNTNSAQTRSARTGNTRRGENGSRDRPDKSGGGATLLPQGAGNPAAPRGK